jgi:ABC-2 type transport system permease protein
VTTAAITPSAAELFDDRKTHTTLWHVLKSEWTKFWSVRSTAWTLLILFVATVGISVLASWGNSISLARMSKVERAQLDVVYISMAGITLGQLAIAVLGALIVTTEYSTGGIKATLIAVPNRMRVLLAKGIILAVVALVVGLITTFVSFYLSMLFWNGKHLEAHLGDPGVLRAVIGGGLYIMASGLFGFALGAVLRHTAGAITAAVGLLLVVPPLMGLLPGTWGDTIQKYFTSNAGSRIASVVDMPNTVSPWIGYLTITIWWVVPLLVGAWLLQTRDA